MVLSTSDAVIGQLKMGKWKHIDRSVTLCFNHLNMVSTFAWSVANNWHLDLGHRYGSLGVDYIAFTVLNILQESSVVCVCSTAS